MAKALSTIKAAAEVVRDETTIGANTANRVGTLFVDVVNYLANVSAVKVIGALDSVSDLPATANIGDGYYVGNDLYVYVGENGNYVNPKWTEIQSMQGLAGNDGVGITSITTQTSSESGGTNVVTITMTDGTIYTFNVMNGLADVEAAFAWAEDTSDQTNWDTDKIYIVPSGTPNVFNIYYYLNSTWNASSETITTATTVVNDLTTGGTAVALSAEQGVVLNEKIIGEVVLEDNTLNHMRKYTTTNKLVMDSVSGVLTAGTSNYQRTTSIWASKGMLLHFTATKVTATDRPITFAMYASTPTTAMSPIAGVSVYTKTLTGTGAVSADYYCETEGWVGLYLYGYEITSYYTDITLTAEIVYYKNEQISANRSNSVDFKTLQPCAIIAQENLNLSGTLETQLNDTTKFVYVYDVSDFVGMDVEIVGALKNGASTLLWSCSSDCEFRDANNITQKSVKFSRNTAVMPVADIFVIESGTKYLAVNVITNASTPASCVVSVPVSDWVEEHFDDDVCYLPLSTSNVYEQSKLDTSTGELVSAIGQAINVYVYDVRSYQGRKIKIKNAANIGLFSTTFYVVSQNGTFDSDDTIVAFSPLRYGRNYGDTEIEVIIESTWNYIGIPSTEGDYSAYVQFTNAEVNEEQEARIISLESRATTTEGNISVLQTQVDSIGEAVGGNFDTDILCWGNSLTVGNQDGEGPTYPSVLAAELGTTDYINAGVGGETTNEVAIRQGGDGFWIPAGEINGTYSYDAFTDMFGATVHMANAYDWAGNSLNPINISGYDAQLTLSDETYTISGYSGGTSAVPLFAVGHGQTIKAKIVCIWVLANGVVVGDSGRSTGEMAQILIDSMIKQIGHEHYIIIGYTGTKEIVDSPAKYEYLDKYLQKYGDKFLHARWLLSQYGMDLLGMTPTTEDEQYIANYRIPPSLFYDNVHLNQYGYTALGKFVAQRCKALKYDILL